MARINSISHRRGDSGQRRPLCSVRLLLFVVLFVIILPLLIWVQAQYYEAIISSSSVIASDGDVVVNRNNGASSSSTTTPTTIAYAISLIKCSDFQSSTSGLLDAATILRHSIHKQSIRTPSSGSKYDYKLYAIVHTNAASCSNILSDLGYEIIVKDSPVQAEEIWGEYLRKHIHKEWCCGSDEFVKLLAYTILDHPIVVHTDIDFMYVKPMDDLYDAMLLPSSEEGGRLARERIEMEYPDKVMPEKIDAFLTRDYHQVIPGRKAAFQAGFIVLRPDMDTFHRYLEIIREGNYVEGFSRENGWGGKGYGGVVGSMAMQGLPAYFYDEIKPNTSVELNGCRYNHMGADIFYDDVPNFIRKYKDLHGKCRRNVEGCEDCRKTDVELIKNIHFTNCRKPWNCAGKGGTQKGYIDPRTADYDHCMKVIRKWHEMRTDLEDSIKEITGDTAVFDGQKGEYKKDIFMGHCNDDGQDGYIPISASKDAMATAAEQIWSVKW
ncbi:predicted protein [Thalassiosira pseudonana CCMP1335]|uniref:Nucleotide-diphospho-sugar transferase domain-containing protein n=1 Tax=Thalassiosira pseudonana TaxID=35128 RepID=B8CC08_THAPS|nr:predicted protein [Thalassiosira pseudonana CCMP1335]EED88875.1 predicted protein [Thalassiosira pseudonana CCMP1335]